MSDVLYVGQAVLDWMRDQTARPPEPGYRPPGTIAHLSGLPVVLDVGLPPGAWRLVRDGQQASEGYIGREGEITAYLDGHGFVTFAEPEISTPVEIHIPRADPGDWRYRAWASILCLSPEPGLPKVTDG